MKPLFVVFYVVLGIAVSAAIQFITKPKNKQSATLIIVYTVLFGIFAALNIVFGFSAAAGTIMAGSVIGTITGHIVRNVAAKRSDITEKETFSWTKEDM